jgi:Zn-dependent M16 (insulinase) family peptidase
MNSADQTEQIRKLTKQMRSTDFRERLNGIEEFQKLCELETNTAIQSLIQIFDGFNECLADMNSKVVLKALNTMHQLVPILGDALSSVINSTLPVIAQSIASKNREISQLASDIIDATLEYIGK